MLCKNWCLTLGVVVAIICAGLSAAAGFAPSAHAVDCTDVMAQPVNVTIQPAGKRLELKPGQVVESTFIVRNSGCRGYDFKVSAQPFYPEEGTGKFDYAKDNKWTQISRYITFAKTNYRLEPGEQADVSYKISVPGGDKMASGGQFAAIQVAATEKKSGSVHTVQQVMYQIFAQMSGKVVHDSKITSQSINFLSFGDKLATSFRARNNGNVDASAIGSIEVRGLLGNVAFASPDKEKVRAVVFPSTELPTKEVVWKNARPGIYIVKQTVNLDGKTKEYSQLAFMIPVWQVILLVLTIMVVLLAYIKRRSPTTLNTKTKYEKIDPLF